MCAVWRLKQRSTEFESLTHHYKSVETFAYPSALPKLLHSRWTQQAYLQHSIEFDSPTYHYKSVETHAYSSALQNYSTWGVVLEKIQHSFCLQRMPVSFKTQVVQFLQCTWRIGSIYISLIITCNYQCLEAIKECMKCHNEHFLYFLFDDVK